MQVIISILSNSIDIFKARDIEKKYINIDIYEDDIHYFISIKDSAGGIKEDIIDKIFEPYFTTKHKYQGTGLGLYMTRKIINSSMGGEITVQNRKFVHNQKKYEGAEFKIKIPIKLD